MTFLLDTYKFIRLFRLENEELFVGLLHESEIIERNWLNPMVHVKMNEKDFNQNNLSSIVARAQLGKERTLPLYLTTQNLREGRAVYFIPNPGGVSNKEIGEVRAYFSDVDFAKKSYEHDNEDEANKQKERFEASGKYESVKISKKQGKYVVDTRLTCIEIDKKKEEFRAEHKDIFSICLVLETYAGFHIYWLLETPEKTNDYSAIQKALAVKLGADESINNLARAMRIPGFYHMKYGKPFEIKVINWPTKRWSKDEIIRTYELNTKEKQVAGVKIVEKKEVKYSGKTVFYTEKKLIQKPDIIFKKPNLPISKRKEISLNLFLEEVKKKPFTDFIESPYMGLGSMCCPFHHDKKPSAGVFITENEEYGYKCHSCDVGYKDIIGVYTQTFNSGFLDAVNALAAISGYCIVSTEFEKKQFEKYRLNRRFLIKEDIETFYPNLWHWIKPTTRSNCRMDLLDFMNSFAEASLVKEEYQHNGEQTFFLAFHEMERRMGRQSVTTIFRAIKLFNILGLVDNVRKSDIHPDLKKNSEKQRLKGMWKLKADREQQGKIFNESLYEEINYYIVPLWQDRIDEIEKMAKKLIDCGFTFKDNLSKKGIEILLGKEVADKVYPSERVVAKKHSKLFEKFNNKVVEKVEEKGFYVLENIVDEKIRVTEGKKQRWLKSDEKLKYIKEFASAIKNENNYFTEIVQKEEKKLMFGFTRKKPARINVFIPRKK
ncbi:CHC2 zinc finger domain-containing protein [Streptomyces sp. ID01-9D]|uniref:CHC2 zinc finger domain-containing protein n=1 Tax=Streptomyces sp. ID01-9D TaxID=3028659 RepID=UPI0029CA93AC|nr:CHC2 zinc finger domain-containing protein [Streptomyces sp. ID01-9D]